MSAGYILYLRVYLLLFIALGVAAVQQQRSEAENVTNTEFMAINTKWSEMLQPRNKWFRSRSNSAVGVNTDGQRRWFPSYSRPHRQANSRGLKFPRPTPGSYNTILTFAQQQAKKVAYQREQEAKRRKQQPKNSMKQGSGKKVDKFLQTYWGNEI